MIVESEGFALGTEKKISLLGEEGVEVVGGRIDLKKYFCRLKKRL